MYYHNTKYRFTLPEGSPSTLPGAIILASAMPSGQMLRRDMRKQDFLQHRLFDPQLYLAGLDPYTARKPICNLATWAWFGEHDVEPYDSSRDHSIKAWKDANERELIASWRRIPPSSASEISRAAAAAISIQIQLGCEGIILPAPLTNVAITDYEVEGKWIDAGLDYCKRNHVRLPIYASIALSDNVLRGVDARQNRLLHSISNQVSARPELAGAYIVIEQASEEGYVCTNRETLLSLLILTDDLSRGAARQVIVNYMGTFGPVALAAGASLFGSGYYLSQRRLRLSDFEDKDARAYPRYMSKRLAGDIGIAQDLSDAYSVIGDTLLTDTPPASSINRAIRNGVSTSRVPEWAYEQQNITAAGAHYNWVMVELGRTVAAAMPKQRPAIIHRWLKTAARDAETLQSNGLTRARSDVVHQVVWLDAFNTWAKHAGVSI